MHNDTCVFIMEIALNFKWLSNLFTKRHMTLMVLCIVQGKITTLNNTITKEQQICKLEIETYRV